MLCDEHNRPPIEKYLSVAGPIPQLEFVFVPSSRWERVYRYPMLFYPLYNRWHRRAYKIARNLHARLPFDLAHQLTFCGFREPGYLWKLGVPFVWGPVGGVQNFPWRFLPAAGMVGGIREAIRNVVNVGQLHLFAEYAKQLERRKWCWRPTPQMLELCPAKQYRSALDVGCRRELTEYAAATQFPAWRPAPFIVERSIRTPQGVAFVASIAGKPASNRAVRAAYSRARAAGTSVAPIGASLRY